MCGIVGYLGKKDPIEYIFSGLLLLQNRGYDSVGMSRIIDNKLYTTKCASTQTFNAIELLKNKIKVDEDKDFKLANDSIYAAIGHTRWATHGSKTDNNAHPHHDNKNRIALVHNGIIENFQELKKELLNESYTFNSQTDTEVVAVLIGKYMDNGYSVSVAIEKTIHRLVGTWALVIINSEHPNKMWITRNGSPLILGIDEDYVMVASEEIAFNNYIKKYIILDNHDLIEITHTKETILYNKNIQNYNLNNKLHSIIEKEPTNYTHWMMQEIMEQPVAVYRAINNGGRIESVETVKLGGLDNCKKNLLELKHIILLGCGTSYHAGLWALDIFKSLSIFDTVTIYDGAEFNSKDVPRTGKTGAILLSQSGETKDLHRCLQIIQDNNMSSIGIVNVVDSFIARETDCGVYLNAGREVAVASTKSFTNQCVVLSLIAVWFSQNFKTAIEKRKRILKDLSNLPQHIENILHGENINNVKTIANKIKSATSLFILGKGKEQAIAKEGSLKLKEVSYIHAEGYSSSALKHGPFGMIVPELPIILIDINEDMRDKNQNAYQEITAREATVIRISENNNIGDLVIEDNYTFGGLLANVYLQLLSYYCAIENGTNPDFPRNLAKVVTVE
jgi:glucosamine--fructose-6-phosphate aminotransferase (isomerizing)